MCNNSVKSETYYFSSLRVKKSYEHIVWNPELRLDIKRLSIHGIVMGRRPSWRAIGPLRIHISRPRDSEV